MIQGYKKAVKSKQFKRLVIALDGKERTGKTTFALTAPDPIVYFPLDPGREGVIEKVAGDKTIYLPMGEKDLVETFNYRDATQIKEWERIWEKLKGEFFKILAVKEVRTIVIDTFTEAYELVRLARLGKLTQVMPHHYGPVNTELRDMIKKIYDTDKNLILVHKVKPEYINDKRTGQVERAGFGDVGYLVQINLQLRWNKEEGFSAHIVDCRQNMDIAGETLQEPMNTFPALASNVYPETSEGDWE